MRHAMINRCLPIFTAYPIKMYGLKMSLLVAWDECH